MFPNGWHFLVADRVGRFQSRAVSTAIANSKATDDFCFTIWKLWFLLKYVLFFLQVFLTRKADIKDEMTFVIER